MNASIEISLYPLREDFKTVILAFIAKLKDNTTLRIETNSLSTQIFGDYDEIMRVLSGELKEVFAANKAVAVMKIIGRPGEI